MYAGTRRLVKNPKILLLFSMHGHDDRGVDGSRLWPRSCWVSVVSKNPVALLSAPARTWKHFDGMVAFPKSVPEVLRKTPVVTCVDTKRGSLRKLCVDTVGSHSLCCGTMVGVRTGAQAAAVYGINRKRATKKTLSPGDFVEAGDHASDC